MLVESSVRVNFYCFKEVIDPFIDVFDSIYVLFCIDFHEIATLAESGPPVPDLERQRSWSKVL